MRAYTIFSETFVPLAYGICRELPHFLKVLFMRKVNFEKKNLSLPIENLHLNVYYTLM